jgi:hypothetical protein
VSRKGILQAAPGDYDPEPKAHVLTLYSPFEIKG